jgi:hypothetical protein
MRLLLLFYVLTISCAISFASPKRQCAEVYSYARHRLDECYVGASINFNCEEINFIDGDVSDCLNALKDAQCTDVVSAFTSHCEIFFGLPL